MNGFLDDLKIFYRPTTETVVGDEGMIHGVEFDLPAVGSRINGIREVGGVSVKGNFYLANLDVGLRFPLLEFMIGVLVDYGITPSQLAPNAWCILSTFSIRCRMVQVYLTFRIFRLFYRLNGKRVGISFRLFSRLKVVVHNLTNVKNWKGRFVCF